MESVVRTIGALRQLPHAAPHDEFGGHRHPRVDFPAFQHVDRHLDRLVAHPVAILLDGGEGRREVFGHADVVVLYISFNC